jgi:FixJ family two-component response regulator
VVAPPRYLVAIVEDNPGVLESLENLLQSSGYDVRGYSSARSFLESGAVLEVDCVISDISMPQMDGLELQTQLGKDRPLLPVILITARYEVGHVGGLAANNRGVFQKPVDPFALLKSVSDAIGK